MSFLCNACKTTFSETRDTVFFDLRTPEDKVMMAFKMLLVTVGLSDIGFVLGVSGETVLMWLERAAQKAHEMNAYLLRDVPVTEVQLDEMWSFIKRKHAQQAESDGESSDLSADGRQWVWISFAPEYRLILAVFVGPRTFKSALQLMQMTAAVVLGVPSAWQSWDCRSAPVCLRVLTLHCVMPWHLWCEKASISARIAPK